MATEIKYNQEFVDLVSELITINKSVVLEPCEDVGKICLSMADGDKSISYTLSAPIENFHLEEPIAFYNFGEFYAFYKSIKNATLSLDGNKLIVRGDGSKINYLLSDIEVVSEYKPKAVNFKNPNITFEVTAAVLSEMNKMIGLAKAKYVKIVSNLAKNVVTLKIYNGDSDHSAERRLPITETTNLDEDFEMDILSDHLQKIPSGKNYLFQIASAKILKISMISENDIDLNIFTARKKV